MALHDWFDWTNSVIGAVGFTLTVGAIIQATGAKKAASQARRAVYRLNVLDDARRLEHLASSLLTAIETGQVGLALYHARDFLSECQYTREHHRARLGTEGGKLDEAFDLIRAISMVLQTGREPNILIDRAQVLLGAISSLAGVLRRETEAEA
jgi:hypothetical protein